MVHTISNDNLSVSVSELGAELQSIRGKNNIEYLWQGAPKYWSDQALTIFPYVARLTDGAYYFQNVRYEMPIHGFAPTAQFSLKEKGMDYIVFILTDSKQTYNQYPFQFEFQVSYKLHGDTLQVIYTVKNLDEKTMYFGIGGHPGFNVPLEPGLSFEDYSLTFSQPCTPVRVGFSKDCFITGEDKPFNLVDDRILPLHHNLFNDDAIVLKQTSSKVSLTSKFGKHGLSMSFSDYPILGIWHWPKSDAPYICLEPWSSLPSRQGIVEHLEKQSDLIRLETSKVHTSNFEISFFS